MGKKLNVNCSVCDLRYLREETLAAYESIQINSATTLVSEETAALLGRYAVKMNCATTLMVEANTKIKIMNGNAELSGEDTGAPGERLLLMVNGRLLVKSGVEEALKQYVNIFVNGSVLYPRSLGERLWMMQVNGSMKSYPDGAVLLKRNAVIDRTFALRARKALYWAERRMFFVDSQLRPQALVDKGATFSTKEAIIAEALVEALVGRIDEETEITIVPDGTAVVLDDLELNDTALRRYGSRIYLIGNLKVAKDAEEVLRQMEYLNVRGDVFVPKELKDRLLEIKGEISGAIRVPRGREIRDCAAARISQWLLEQTPDGVLVADCAAVQVDEDVDKKLILERLTISDCATVTCSRDQEDAIGAVCTDVGRISTDGNVQKAQEQTDSDPDLITINAAQYTL